MNRLIVEEDKESGITCHVTSSTHASKTRTNVVVSKGKYYLKQNNFQDVSIFSHTKTNYLVILFIISVKDIPDAIIFKAMGIISDQEIV